MSNRTNVNPHYEWLEAFKEGKVRLWGWTYQQVKDAMREYQQTHFAGATKTEEEQT